MKMKKITIWIFIITILLIVFIIVDVIKDKNKNGGYLTQAGWNIYEEPIFSGKYIASDPAVIKEGDKYVMYYTDLDFLDGVFKDENIRTGIARAVSDDGLNWKHEKFVVMGREGEWDEEIEASSVVKKDSQYLLYYSGYTHGVQFPASLAVSHSTDGKNFVRVNNGSPILEPTIGGYDNDAIFSPVVIEDKEKFYMVYSGHCYTNCDNGYGVFLLGATSTDGINWEKYNTPILESSDIKWMKEGVAESALIKGPDDRFYLFFTGLNGKERTIGLAVGDSPFGPYKIQKKPLISKSGGFDVLAPDVLIEGDKIRMWYLITKEGTDDQKYDIGYAEANWPLDLSF